MAFLRKQRKRTSNFWGVTLSRILGGIYQRGIYVPSVLAKLTSVVRLDVVSAGEIPIGLRHKLQLDGKVVLGAWSEESRRVKRKVVGSRPLFSRKYRGAILSPNRRGGFIVMNQNLITPILEFEGAPRLSFPGHEVGGILRQQDDNIWWQRPHRISHLEKGIFCGSLAPYNWYHWVVDTLPTIWLASRLSSEFADYPILVPREVKNRETWLESLEMVTQGRRLEWVDQNSAYKIDDLIVIDNVTGGVPRPLRHNGENRIWFHEAALESYVRHVLAQCGIGQSIESTLPKIFIGRKPNSARQYNQNQVLEIAQQFGYQRVFLEEMTFKQSVELFAGAESVVGPHGAGWANLLFANKRPKGLLWTWRDSRGDNWYENIALASQSKIQIWFQNTNGLRDFRSADYLVDTAQLERSLTRLESQP